MFKYVIIWPCNHNGYIFDGDNIDITVLKKMLFGDTMDIRLYIYLNHSWDQDNRFPSYWPTGFAKSWVNIIH